MVFQHRLFHYLSSVLLVLSFSVANICVAQGPDDDVEISSESTEISPALLQWLKDTEVKISGELKEKQGRSAYTLTVSTKLILFFALLRDYQQGDIHLPAFMTAFAVMTAITYYSTKHLQRFDRLFTKPIPWKKLWPSFLKRKKPPTELGSLLTYKQKNPSNFAPFLDSLVRRGLFNGLTISLINLVLHSKNELVNNSHAIWTQAGIFETASLVLAATFGSSMFHTIRNTFVKNPAKSEKVYSLTSMFALNLVALYQLGFHAAIPATLTGLPFNIHATLGATYLTYAAGSIASFMMRDRKPKNVEQTESTVADSDAAASPKVVVLPIQNDNNSKSSECNLGFREANSKVSNL